MAGKKILRGADMVFVALHGVEEAVRIVRNSDKGDIVRLAALDISEDTRPGIPARLQSRTLPRNLFHSDAAAKQKLHDCPYGSTHSAAVRQYGVHFPVYLHKIIGAAESVEKIVHAIHPQPFQSELKRP